MNAAIEKRNASNSSDLCTVVVIYDDDTTRARALRACDYLIRQDWENVELDFHWWRTDFLKDPYMAEVAAHHAIVSDILIVSSREPHEISTTLKEWFESWLGKRKNYEGALIDLAGTQLGGNRAPRRNKLLQEIAVRGRFDYLTAVPEQSRMEAFGPTEMPSAPASIDDFRDRSHPPSHYGLNE